MKFDSFVQDKTSWFCVLMILATIAVTYLPVVAFDYGYADDYWVLSMRPLNHEVLSLNIENNNTEGRPLLNIWQLGVFGLCSGIQDLKAVRFLSLLGIFFASLVFYKLIRRHLIEDPIDASLISSIFAVNPSFLIIGGWAENGFISYGCLLGLLSSFVLLPDTLSNTDSDRHSLPKRPWFRIALAALLLFGATFLYQPAGMIYWTGIAIWLIGRFKASHEDWKKLILITVLFFAVIVIYFLICHTLWPPSNRFHLSFSFVRRMGWFVLFPLNSTLSYPFIEPVSVWSAIALLILSVGIWRFCQQTSRTMWIPPLILAMSPLTELPMIVAYVHYDVSRTRAAIYGIIVILWAVTIKAGIFRYGKSALKMRHILIPIWILLIASGQYHLERYFIMPQVWEESALLIKLQEYVRENPHLDRTIAIRPPPTDITEFHGVDEMGFASLSRPTPEFEIWIILAGIAHIGVEDAKGLNLITLHDETPPQDAFIIDFSELRAPR